MTAKFKNSGTYDGNTEWYVVGPGRRDLYQLLGGMIRETPSRRCRRGRGMAQDRDAPKTWSAWFWLDIADPDSHVNVTIPDGTSAAGAKRLMREAIRRATEALAEVS